MMFFVSFFPCDLQNLQDFKFWCADCKAFGTSFLYWVDFTYYLLTTYIRQRISENDNFSLLLVPYLCLQKRGGVQKCLKLCLRSIWMAPQATWACWRRQRIWHVQRCRWWVFQSDGDSEDWHESSATRKASPEKVGEYQKGSRVPLTIIGARTGKRPSQGRVDRTQQVRLRLDLRALI